MTPRSNDPRTIDGALTHRPTFTSPEHTGALPPIDFFDGDDGFDFLSNFYPSRVRIPEFGDFGEQDAEEVPCKTVEHGFAAMKTLDPQARQRVVDAPTPGKAKMLGRTIALRPDWEDVKAPVMYALLRQKFAPGTELAEKLMATYPRLLIEGTLWEDRVWGIYEGQGANLLGHLLMAVRAELLARRKPWESLAAAAQGETL